MTDRVRITVLVENTAEGRGLLGEHGLAFWIKAGSRRILFDTGQSGGVLANNAYRLGVSLERLDALALSHGHYDHAGGLAEVFRGDGNVRFYAHPDALRPKFARNKDGTSREIGIPAASLQAVERRRLQFVPTERPTPLFDGLTLTGPVPRTNDFEDTGGPFFLDADCRKPDPLVDDQAVFFPSDRGTVVLLGCAHSGVVNTLRYVQELTGGRPIHAVLGGMHLVGASADRLAKTIAALDEMGIDVLGPAHCTGRPATAALWDAFAGRCIACHAGTQVEFPISAPVTEGDQS